MKAFEVYLNSNSKTPKISCLFINPILQRWFRDSCFTCDGSLTTQVFPLLSYRDMASIGNKTLQEPKYSKRMKAIEFLFKLSEIQIAKLKKSPVSII